MSSGDKSRPKTGSAFKMPSGRKPAKASTPTGDKTVSLDCNISAISSFTPLEGRSKPTPGCEPSQPRKTGRQAMPPIKKALYNPGGHDTSMAGGKALASKQMELDMAYNNYLIALANNTVQEKQYADTKAQIDADLGALTKRLAVNQQNLENTKQRIAKISFMSEQDRLLKSQRDAYAQTLEHVEGEMTDRICDVGAALDEKTSHLELRNIATGTAELKKVLADSSRVLSQLRASGQSDEGVRAMAAAQHLRNATETMRSVSARYKRVAKKLPEYQAAPTTERALKLLEADQTSEEATILHEDA